MREIGQLSPAICDWLRRAVTPTGRLLELLELLQRQTLTTGTEIAYRLEVDRRTVRRYIAALHELGIPIEGQRGVGGGYRIRPGFRLPPLMLDDDEAVVVALGVVTAGRLGLAGSTESVEGALAKIHRVLPDLLRRRVEALEATLDFTSSGPRGGAPVTGETVLLLAEAIRRRLRLRAGYTSFSGEVTRRQLSPYGLVVHSGPLVPRRVRPRPSRPAHVQSRPHATSGPLQAGGRAAARGLRRRRVREPLARARAVAARGRSPARPDARAGEPAPARPQRWPSSPRPRADAAAHARRVARTGRPSSSPAWSAALRSSSPTSSATACGRWRTASWLRALDPEPSVETVASDVVGNVDGLVGAGVRSPAAGEGAVLAPGAGEGRVQLTVRHRDGHAVAPDVPSVRQRRRSESGEHRRRERMSRGRSRSARGRRSEGP